MTGKERRKKYYNILKDKTHFNYIFFFISLARPCGRCVKRGLQDTCENGQRKKAKYLTVDEEEEGEVEELISKGLPIIPPISNDVNNKSSSPSGSMPAAGILKNQMAFIKIVHIEFAKEIKCLLTL